MKYRERPVVIKAWRIGRGSPMPGWVAHAFLRRAIRWHGTGGCLVIRAREGVTRAAAGDWLIRGALGGLYACKAEIFDAMYERV
jgi:hypothetical protein